MANANLRSCSLKNASPENLEDITRSNLAALGSILDYNRRNAIRMSRISSDLIPFGSHPDVDFAWDALFAEELSALGDKARSGDIRLSMHPGQYTVLNSPDPRVVERAVKDLDYHCRLLDSLNCDSSSKIILHVGGAYGNKEEALARFAETYRNLDDGIRRRLVIENDDRIFTIEDVLELGIAVGAPVVFDNLHHAVNPSGTDLGEAAWINACTQTWRDADGTPKTHYSQQAPDKKAGSHSRTIDAAAFSAYVGTLTDDVDVMLEVKDKNLSALKCTLCLRSPGKIQDLEKEWARYKYLVLEYSPRAYSTIRSLLKDKTAYPALAFYEQVDAALRETPEAGVRVNAAQHVWGYFSDRATEQEKKRFAGLLAKYTEGNGSIGAAKRYLHKLALKYDERYLLESLYFAID